MIATNLNEGATDHYRTPSLLHKHSPILSSLRNRLPNGITDQSERLNKIRNLAQTTIPTGISPVLIGLAITMASLTSYHSAEATFAHLRDPNTVLPTSVIAVAENTDANIELEEHQVKPGETLSEIAERYNLSVDTILWANDLSIDTPIKAGDTIAILPFNGLMYTAKSGDSVEALAKRFQVKVKDITGANRLRGTKLAAGQEIFIPTNNSLLSFTLARGGPDEQENDDSAQNSEEETVEEVIEDESIEASETIKEVVEETVENIVEEVVPVASAAPTNSGWLHPVPGSLVTQGSHGRYDAVDFGAPVGSSVIAADGGVVTLAKTGYNGGYGHYIIIDHQDGTETLYSHFSDMLVSVGDTVTTGQLLGYVGMTGRTTGPNIHFEIRGASNPFTQCGYLTRCGS